MELKIHLNNRAEVEAGHALLALIIGGEIDIPASGSHTHSVSVGDVSRTVSGPTTAAVQSLLHVHDNPSAGQASAAEVFGGNAQPDPAAVFGSTPAPSSAGAAPLSTALAALPGTSLAPLIAASAPAAHIAPEVHAQQHALIAAGAGHGNPAPGVELDKNGLPWDERIHSGGKERKNADGSWRAKRGVDANLVAQVTAHLRAQLAAGGTTSPQSPAAAPPVAAPAPSNLAPLGALGGTASPDPVTFEQLVARVVPLSTPNAAGQSVIPMTALQDICTESGLHGVTHLQQLPQHVPEIWKRLKARFPALV